MAHRSESSGTLHRELSVWEAIGLSLALMAPSMAANINPQATAGTVGRAVPLAFLLATLALIAYTFVRLCQRFHHAGSVYASSARPGALASSRLVAVGHLRLLRWSPRPRPGSRRRRARLARHLARTSRRGRVRRRAVALPLVLVLWTRVRAAPALLTIEGITVALILVAVRCRAAGHRHRAGRTRDRPHRSRPRRAPTYRRCSGTSSASVVRASRRRDARRGDP